MKKRTNNAVAVSDVVSALRAVVLCAERDIFVQWVIASGMMSDVLTTEEEGILLISNLTSVQVIRTADMVGAPAVVIASGKQIPESTTDLAAKLGIMLICTPMPVFEACCALSPLFFEA